MASRKLIILSSLAVPVSLLAQSATDYVHRGAQEYIFGREGAAKAAVLGGLEKFPNDPELQQMAGLFHDEKDKKQQEQDQQQQDQKQSQDQQSQDQQSKDQKQQNQNEKSDKKEDKSDQPKPDASQTPSPSPGKENEDQQEKGQEDKASPTPGEGSPQPTASPTPGDGQGEGASPSPGPSASPQKKMAGELKEASDKKPENPSDQTAEIGEAEPEKEGQMSERQALALLQSLKDEEARVRLDERKAGRRVYKDW